MQDAINLVTVALCAAIAVWVVRRLRARAAAAAEAQAQKHALWLQRVAHQNRVRERLSHLNEESLSLIESMPGCVATAESHLDQAEVEFADRAFAPFWSAVEHAARSLAGIHESVQKLECNSGEYAALLTQVRGQAPSFAVTCRATSRLSIATATSQRMHGIVRRAQRDFEFSVIYEHRKTNQILVAGFTHLAQAIDEMASRLSASIDGLTASVDKMTTALDETLRRLSSKSGNRTTETPDSAANREQRVMENLDAIAWARYPTAIQHTEAGAHNAAFHTGSVLTASTT